MKSFGRLLLVLLLFGSQSQAGPYLVGEIGLQRQVEDMYSTALVTCYNTWGDYDDLCYFAGQHMIFDVGDSRILIERPYAITGEYNNFLRATPTLGRCYRARVSGEIPHGFSNYWGSSQVCAIEQPERYPPVDCPVLLDLDANGFHLSSASEPVSFDINADGELDQLAWTAASEQDAFLCMDRNDNGAVDDGSELFGQDTLLFSGGRAGLGYTAMADLDLPEQGGNFDGVLDSGDQAFEQLCVWVDSNHDGISQPHEIRGLPEAGVERLGFDWENVSRRDQHGNLFWFKGKGWVRNPSGNARAISTYDVVFARP